MNEGPAATSAVPEATEILPLEYCRHEPPLPRSLADLARLRRILCVTVGLAVGTAALLVVVPILVYGVVNGLFALLGDDPLWSMLGLLFGMLGFGVLVLACDWVRSSRRTTTDEHR